MRVGHHGGPSVPEPDPAASSTEEPAAPAAEPRLPKGKDFDGVAFGSLGWKPVAGDPYVNGVAPKDVVQGRLGDCFFLSAAVAVAATHPDVIKSAIKSNADGTYTVRLFDAKGKPAPVTVKPDFPSDAHGRQLFGKGAESNAKGQELWPAILEKAFAQSQKNGYATLNGGGFGDRALLALTGKRASHRQLSSLSNDAAWKLVSDAVQAKRPVTSGTPDIRELKSRTGRKDQGGLIDDHDYALLKAYTRGGQRWVDLYSPLSPELPVGADIKRSADGRTITLPFEAWKKSFEDVKIGGA